MLPPLQKTPKYTQASVIFHQNKASNSHVWADWPNKFAAFLLKKTLHIVLLKKYYTVCLTFQSLDLPVIRLVDAAPSRPGASADPDQCLVSEHGNVYFSMLIICLTIANRTSVFNTYFLIFLSKQSCFYDLKDEHSFFKTLLWICGHCLIDNHFDNWQIVLVIYWFFLHIYLCLPVPASLSLMW